MEENRRLGIYVPSDVEEYIVEVQKELKSIYGGRVSMGMAVSEIVRRLKEYEKRNK